MEELNHKHADRMRFYLSKADEAGHESDRQVRQQKSLVSCYQHEKNKAGTEKKTFYIELMGKISRF